MADLPNKNRSAAWPLIQSENPGRTCQLFRYFTGVLNFPDTVLAQLNDYERLGGMMNGKRMPKRDYSNSVGDRYQFQLIISQRFPWFAQADLLLVTALRLWETIKNEEAQRIESSAVVAMLLSYSFENLFKGFWISKHAFDPAFSCREIQRRCDENQNIGPLKLHEEFLNCKHDLLKLAQSCECEINERERQVLSLLSRYGEWAGRYPAPSKSHQFDFKDQSGKILRPGLNLVTLFEENVIQNLMTRILNLARTDLPRETTSN